MSLSDMLAALFRGKQKDARAETILSLAHRADRERPGTAVLPACEDREREDAALLQLK